MSQGGKREREAKKQTLNYRGQTDDYQGREDGLNRQWRLVSTCEDHWKTKLKTF